MLQLGRIEANSFNFLPPFFPPTSTHLHEEVAVLDMQHFDDRNVFENVAENASHKVSLHFEQRHSHTHARTYTDSHTHMHAHTQPSE
jgi:hypothetical protein